MVVDTCEVFCLLDFYIINGASHVLDFGWGGELVNQQKQSLGTMPCDHVPLHLYYFVCVCVVSNG